MVARIEQIVQEELGGRPYYLAGHPYMKAEIARTMQSDLSVFLPVTLAVMGVFLIVGVDGTGVYESSWGADSSGAERHGSAPSNLCGVTTKDDTESCP